MDKSDNDLILSQVNNGIGTLDSRELVSILKKTTIKKQLSAADMTATRALINNSNNKKTCSLTSNADEQPATRLFASQSSAAKRPQKPRRRVATIAQRRAANIRERRRMFNLNAAFDRLRKKVPSFAYEKRLSRIETLKLAIMYIRFMDDLVNDDSYVEKYKQLIANSQSNQHQQQQQNSSSTVQTSPSASFFSSNSYLSLYGAAGSQHSPASNSIPKNNNRQSSIGSSAGKADCQEGCCTISASDNNNNSKSFKGAQYRGVCQTGLLSPTGLCCSSPGASSILTTATPTTCHSSSTSSSTFTDSPSPSGAASGLAGSQSEPAYSYQHQQQQQQYPVSYEQRFQDNIISSISPYYGCEQIKSLASAYTSSNSNYNANTSSSKPSGIADHKPDEMTYATNYYQQQPAHQESTTHHYSLHSLQAR